MLGIFEKNETVRAIGERLVHYAFCAPNGERTILELLDTPDAGISRFGFSM